MNEKSQHAPYRKFIYIDVRLSGQLWCTFFQPDRVQYAFNKSLENLGLDYVDLFLMHFPVALAYHDDDDAWPKNADGTQETV